jgi:hypothetical protein
MKSTCLFTRILLLALSVFFVQSYAQAQRRLNKETRPSASTTPSVSSTQQQNLDKLIADLKGIRQGSQVTQAQKEALKADLFAIVDSATRPDASLVEQLATDLASALADGKVSSVEMTRLANDLKKVMNSANIPMSEVNQAIADAQNILTASGIDQSDVQTVVNDLKAIAAEASKNIPGSSGGTKKLRRP